MKYSFKLKNRNELLSRPYTFHFKGLVARKLYRIAVYTAILMVVMFSLQLINLSVKFQIENTFNLFEKSYI